MPDEIIRYTAAVQLRVADTAPDDEYKGRTIEGLAVPWNTPTDLGDGMFEQVARNAFEGSTGVILRDEHGKTIGTIETSDEDDGLHIVGRIANVPDGDNALALIKAKAYHGLSVGFLPKSGGTTVSDDGVITRTAARLCEVSVTGMPAYETAKILATRSAGQPAEEGKTMPDNKLAELESELAIIKTNNEDLQRRMATFTVAAPTGPKVIGAQYRTAGEWIKGVANHEDDAIELANAWKTFQTRAFNGTTTANVAASGVVPPAWVDNTLEFIARNRVTQEVFTRKPLPATGMTVEYLSNATSTLQVQKQDNEGDVLAFGKLTFGASNAAIETFGGYTSLSFQAIQRMPVNLLDEAYQELVNQATYRSNASTRAVLAGATFTAAARGGNTVAAWEGAIISAVAQMASSGYGRSAEFILVDLATFGAMAAVRDSNGTRLMTPGGATADNQSGTMNVGALSGTVLGLPVIVDTTLAANTCLVANSQALVTYGDATPTRLTQDDITNLTTDLSVYYEQATALRYTGSIISITA